MQTRSQILSKHVTFDFDEASLAWKSNKIYQGNGTYVYRCEQIMKNGKPCKKNACLYSDFCKTHNKSL